MTTSVRLPRMAKYLLYLALAALLAGACAPSAPPSPITAPAKPAATSAPAPTVAPKPAAKPTERPAAKPAEQPGADATANPAAMPATESQAVAAFFAGKTLRIIVGSSPGGGYDNYARLIARHLGENLPGKPSVIVENMPGASHLVAANHIFNVAPKDGTVIGSIGSSVIIRQLFGVEAVKLDAAKFRYLGAPASDHHLLIVHKRAGITKLEELLGPNAKRVVMGGQAVGSSTDNPPALARDVLGASIKIVTGYPGTAQIRLAMENGEVDGLALGWESVRASSLDKVKSGEWVILAQYVDEPLEDLPSVPNILSFAKTEKQRQLLRFGNIVPNQFARPYLLPPGVPEARAEALEAAFVKTLKDKEFLADAQKSKLDIEPVPAERLQRMIAEFLTISKEMRDQLKPILLAS